MTQMTFTKPAGEVTARLWSSDVVSPETFAHLAQLDPSLGQRGWEMTIMPWVWDSARGLRGRWVAGETLRTPLQKPGIRPPTPQQRTEALQRLGYESVPLADWEWFETKFVLSELPCLFATLPVRPVSPAVTP